MADQDRKLVVRNALKPMAEKGLPRPHEFFGTSDEKMITPTVFLGPKHNFYSLTVCSFDQYLPHSSEKSGFLS